MAKCSVTNTRVQVHLAQFGVNTYIHACMHPVKLSPIAHLAKNEVNKAIDRGNVT